MKDPTHRTLTGRPSRKPQAPAEFRLFRRKGAAARALLILIFCPALRAGIPAFPGAQGAAGEITGGRGGIVYHVTKLDRNHNHNEPGTLRYGLTDANFPPGAPRTIVFDVAGTFWLGRYGAERGHDNGWDTQSRLNVGSHLTLAGETAPGPVWIMGGVVKVGGTNVILRNIGIAPGYGLRNFAKPDEGIPPTPGDFPDSYVYDALDISGRNVLIDHVTALYATDETISANEQAHAVTIQYCIIAQGQNYPQWDAEGGGYTGHALGSLFQGGSDAPFSVLYNLYAHLKGRLPRVGSEVGTGPVHDFRNNVFYNWFGTAGSGGSGQPSFNNFIHNFYLVGPGGEDPAGGTSTNLVWRTGGTGIFNGVSSLTRVYVAGNVRDGNRDGDPFDTSPADGLYSSVAIQSAAFDLNQGVTLAATGALAHVLRYCGARWWERDDDFTQPQTNAVDRPDERIIRETWTGTGRIRAWADDPFNDDPNEGTEWRALLALRADPVTGAAPFQHPPDWDTDQDGMPDAWEITRGLNPAEFDANEDDDQDGYTNLEEYLHERAAWPAPGVIFFTGPGSRFAAITNWSVFGLPLTIARRGTQPSRSHWQPSRFDTAVITNATVLLDAPGQTAGTLRLEQNARLLVPSGSLEIHGDLVVDGQSRLELSAGARIHVRGRLLNEGTLLLADRALLEVDQTWTNRGRLDILRWQRPLPGHWRSEGMLVDRSAFRIEGVGREPDGTWSLQVRAPAGHHYRLQGAATPAGPWIDLTAPVPGTDDLLTLPDTVSPATGARFYRVVAGP